MLKEFFRKNVYDKNLNLHYRMRSTDINKSTHKINVFLILIVLLTD